MAAATEHNCELHFPVDWLCGQEFKNDQETKLVTKDEGIPDGWEGMDCGPKSMELFHDVRRNHHPCVSAPPRA